MPLLSATHTVLAPGPDRPRRVGEAGGRLLAGRLRERRPRPARRARLRAGDAGRALARRRGGDAVRLPVRRALRAAGAGRRAAGSAASCTPLLRAAALPGAELDAAVAERGGQGDDRSADPRTRARRACVPAPTSRRSGAASSRSVTRRRAAPSCARWVLIDLGGQRVSAHDRLYLTAGLADADRLGRAGPADPGRTRPAGPRPRSRAASSQCSRARATSPTATTRAASRRPCSTS